MLRLMRRGNAEDLRPLAQGEDATLRRAFGRFARVTAREAGAFVVRQHQGGLGGQWFACDCRGGALPPSVLVPVAETHIRRHVESLWPEHAEWCDFYREPQQQVAVSASYRRVASQARSLGLVRRFDQAERPLDRTLIGSSREQRRPRLARVLFELIDRAGLNRIEAAGGRGIAEQFAALRSAAEDIWLDEGASLQRYLCTYPPALPEFIDRIDRTSDTRFRKTRRPHGLVVGVARDASRGTVKPWSGDPFDVAGEIKVFGEVDGHNVARRQTIGARAPYVMACLVGRRQPGEAVQVLRAYLHPCWSERSLFPVDSDYERQTLRQLMRLRQWLSTKNGVDVTITKPLFDMAVDDADDQGVQEPVIPDFIVYADGGGIVVETMGYDLPSYRERKGRMHPAMSRVCGGAPLIEHDFTRPAGLEQAKRDDMFWRACRSGLMAQSSTQAGVAGAGSPFRAKATGLRG